MEYLMSGGSLTSRAWLRGIGATDSTQFVDLKVEMRGAKTTTARVQLAEGGGGGPERLVAPKGVAAPLFLRGMDDGLWEQLLPEQNALYVQVNAILPDKEETMDQFAERLWSIIQKENPKNVILDLRHNNGGVSQWSYGLLRTLLAFNRTTGNQLYVVIGRRTYSAAANFITDLERLGTPIFVGEPSGECCNLHGDPMRILLPYSQVRGSLTARKWGLTSPWDARRELSPDLPVQLTAKAYFAGRDPALEAVFELIKSGKVAKPSDHLLLAPR
jgi:hypothetical protein